MLRLVCAALVASLSCAVASAQAFVNIRSQDAPKYDPHSNTASGMGHPMSMIGDTLVALDRDLKTVHPLLAWSWTVSDDRLTYTFALRNDVTFCSGKKFTADDVIYSFTRLADPSAKRPFFWRLSDIDLLSAPDPCTLVYRLKRPHAELLVDLANFAATIVNKDNVETLGADFGANGFDGTGPLCWEKWERRKELVLKRHDAYKWGPTGVYRNAGPVKYERMIWRIVPEESTRMAAMMAGQADFCHWNPLQAIETLKKAPNLTVYEPATLDVLTRKDPEKSRRLLDEAGCKPGADGFRRKDGRKLELLMSSYNVGQNPKLSEIMHAAACTVGVDIRIQTWDPTVFFQKIAQQDYDIWTLSVPYTSAGDQMYLYYHSRNRPVPNRMMGADPKTDRLLEAGRHASNDADREKYFKEVQQRMHDEALVLPAAHSRLFLVAKKTIKDVRSHGIYSAALYEGLDVKP
jgi:peptide/nickel transport system substrate-binding protein